MPFKDPKKQRAYDRERKRKARAEKALGKITCPKPELVATKTQSRTVTSKTIELANGGDLRPLDVLAYEIGNKALDKALAALELIDPEHLGVLDIKRLAELGLKLRNHSSDALKVREVTDTQKVVLTESVLANPDAMMNAEQLLIASAAEDLEKGVDLIGDSDAKGGAEG